MVWRNILNDIYSAAWAVQTTVFISNRIKHKSFVFISFTSSKCLLNLLKHLKESLPPIKRSLLVSDSIDLCPLTSVFSHASNP